MCLGVMLLVALQVMLSRATMASAMQGNLAQVATGFPDLYAGLSNALPPVAWATGSYVVGRVPCRRSCRSSSQPSSWPACWHLRRSTSSAT